MPSKINPIRKALLKKSLLEGNSIRQSLKDAGYAPGTQRSHNSATHPVVKRCQEEILEEINKTELKKKAYKTLERNCNAPKKSDQNTAATAILKFTVGEIIRESSYTPDEKSEYEKLRANIAITN